MPKWASANFGNHYNTGMSSPERRSVHIATVSKTSKGKTYTSVLLRRTFRENGKVKHETLGNLSDLPADVIEFVRKRLAGELEEDAPSGTFEIVRSLPRCCRRLGTSVLINSSLLAPVGNVS